jgi:RNA polymerase sigma-70 factor, ECF subfamily
MAANATQRPRSRDIRATGLHELDRAVLVFMRARPRLFGIACRILRDPLDAEDVVQDAWIRWQATDRASVVNANAFLVTATTRLALNQAQSARRRRERPAGGRLPDVPEPGPGPGPEIERGEAIEHAMSLLAQLTPSELAAYVLREAFDYPYEQIADLLELSVTNCRQLVRRARQRIASRRDRPAGLTMQRQLVEAFLAAAHGGSLAALEDLLVAGLASPSRSRVSSGGDDPTAA